MKACARCRKEVSIDKYFSRKSACPSCGGDLHVCLNCRFYSQSSHNKCLEPKAEFQRVRDKANFCDYFEFGQSAGEKAGEKGSPIKEDAKKAFDALFKK